MPRRARPQERKTAPDRKYGNVSLAQFNNKLMQRGKRTTAEGIIYGALTQAETTDQLLVAARLREHGGRRVHALGHSRVARYVREQDGHDLPFLRHGPEFRSGGGADLTGRGLSRCCVPQKGLGGGGTCHTTASSISA